MKPQKSRPQLREVPVISFFTGGGFLDMGFEQQGFKVVWSNESNPSFAELYSFGMTNWRRAHNQKSGDAKISCMKKIEKVSAVEIVNAAFPSGKPSLFGIIGGPPCPDFSPGGKHKGGRGINGRLSKIYIQRICKVKPSFFVFENVAGLHKIEKHRKFLQKLERIIEGAGYHIDIKLLNSLEYGVPQDRERLIMIGIQKGLAQKCAGRKINRGEQGWYPWPRPKFINARTKFAWPTKVQEGKRVRKPANVPNSLMVNSILCVKNDPEKVPNGKDCFRAISSKFKTIAEGDTARKSFKRLHRYKYSPTACYGHNEVHLHPWLPRRISVREAMRIQGIPDTYILPSNATLSSKYSLVSNGVPVPLSLAVARSMRKFILDSRNQVSKQR